MLLVIRATVLSLVIALLTTACDDYPRDPEHTLERVSGGTLRVGAVADEPWVVRGSDGLTGVEIDLVQRLARTLNARVTWHGGSEHDVIEALKRRQLDLVVGGLTKSSPRRNAVAFTRPYLETAIVVTGSGPHTVTDLDGQEVMAEPGTVGAAYVEAEGGVLVPPSDDEASRLVARRSWQADRDEHIVRSLRTDRHVFAVPPGENAWLIAVDSFLQTQEQFVRQRLREIDR